MISVTSIKIFATILCLFIYQLASSQSIELKGSVVDENKIGIDRVSIYLKEGKIGTFSDSAGYFILRSEKEISAMDTLFFSCTGFTTKHICVSEFNTGSMVILKPLVFNVKEVTILGKRFKSRKVLKKAVKLLPEYRDTSEGSIKLDVNYLFSVEKGMSSNLHGVFYMENTRVYKNKYTINDFNIYVEDIYVENNDTETFDNEYDYKKVFFPNILKYVNNFEIKRKMKYKLDSVIYLEGDEKLYYISSIPKKVYRSIVRKYRNNIFQRQVSYSIDTIDLPKNTDIYESMSFCVSYPDYGILEHKITWINKTNDKRLSEYISTNKNFYFLSKMEFINKYSKFNQYYYPVSYEFRKVEYQIPKNNTSQEIKLSKRLIIEIQQLAKNKVFDSGEYIKIDNRNSIYNLLLKNQ